MLAAEINSEKKIVELIIDKIPVYQSLAYFSQANIFLKTSTSSQDDIFLQEFLYVKQKEASCMDSGMHGCTKQYKSLYNFNIFSFASFQSVLEEINKVSPNFKEEAAMIDKKYIEQNASEKWIQQNLLDLKDNDRSNYFIKITLFGKSPNMNKIINNHDLKKLEYPTFLEEFHNARNRFILFGYAGMQLYF